MLDSVLRLVRDDAERQADWAREEARLQVRSLTLSIGLMFFAGMCAIGLFAVGLMLLFVWTEPKFGTMTALGFVAAALTVVLLAAITIYFSMRANSPPHERPEVRAANPSALAQAFASDTRVATQATVAKVRASSLGPAISAGEQALETGERLLRMFDELRGKPTSNILLGLAAAVIVGSGIGRTLKR